MVLVSFAADRKYVNGRVINADEIQKSARTEVFSERGQEESREGSGCGDRWVCDERLTMLPAFL